MENKRMSEARLNCLQRAAEVCVEPISYSTVRTVQNSACGQIVVV